MKIFITGAAGYIGSLLTERFVAFEDCVKVIALDKNPLPPHLMSHPKVVPLLVNLIDTRWRTVVAAHNPDIVIHCAWHIRKPNFFQKRRWCENIEGMRNITSFACTASSVRTMVHLSTVAVYGACPRNSTEKLFKETDQLREKEYQYANQKRIAEEIIQHCFEQRRCQGNAPNVFILRLASVSGPRQKLARLKKISLQSFLRIRFPFLCLPKGWCRQFLHEEDLFLFLQKCIQMPRRGDLQVFNVTPPDFITAQAASLALGKKLFFLSPWMAKLLFAILYYTSLGFLPFPRGLWRFICYPLIVDGTKISLMTGLTLRCSQESFRSSLAC